ncbi:MAG: hypothetical protein R2754_10385 [Microthrixaceae bacterium]
MSGGNQATRPDGRATRTTFELEFCGEEWQLLPGDELAFGRDAALTIDESNRYLHRVAGTFSHHDGHWWLRNDGTRLPLTVIEAEGRPMTVLPPGVETSLWPGTFAVRFEAGPARYELRGACPGDPAAGEAGPGAPTHDEADLTRPWGRLELNDDQRAILAALTERQLRDPLAEPGPLPPNRMVAQRLGWSISKFNRKLDHLCARFARHGVRGLQGTAGTSANDRRQHLVDHVMTHSLVCPADLDVLDAICNQVAS